MDEGFVPVGRPVRKVWSCKRNETVDMEGAIGFFRILTKPLKKAVVEKKTV